MYDNFFINLAVHTSLLKNLQFKKAKILVFKIYTPLALIKYICIEVSGGFITIMQ